MKTIGLGLGALAALACALAPIPGLSQDGRFTLALLIVMAVWWVSEAIPLAATALLPIIALPLIGIDIGRDDRGRLTCADPSCGDPSALSDVRLLSLNDLGAHYANPVVLLYIGGFLLGIALERSGLSARIAYTLVARGGADPKRMLAGFIAAGCLISMWISNTSTSLMLTPLALSVAASASPDGRTDTAFSASLVLAIAYAATIGGLGTPIGSPTNGIALLQLRAQGIDVDFAAWMALGVPVVLILAPIAWAILSRGVNISAAESAAAQSRVREALRALGPVSAPEKRVAAIFIITALAWIFSSVLANLIGAHWLRLAAPRRFESGHLDTIIATIAALALFMTPSGNKPNRPLLTWDDASAIPWGVLLLFGGGLALAAGAELSGLSAWLASGLRGLADAPPLVLIGCACLIVIVITEFASNIATISLMGPILLTLSGGALAPAMLLVPAAMAASMGFAMPVGSAANAIAYSTGAVPQARMIRRGLMMNGAALIVLTLTGVYLAPRLLG